MKHLLQTKGRALVTIHYHRLINSFVLHSLLASWFIALLAQIKVPFYPVPMTLQSFAIALIALISPWRVATSAVALYLTYVAIGLPILASGVSGMAAFSGATAGFLVGFMPMTAVIAWLMQRYQPKSIGFRVLISFLGAGCLFSIGLIHLTYLFGWEVAIQTGLVPFIWIEPAKYILAAYLSTWIGTRYSYSSFNEDKGTIS